MPGKWGPLLFVLSFFPLYNISLIITLVNPTTRKSYCASPVSGMGTTLALVGAYNLAGALTRHPNDYAAAFAEYDRKMRPVVDRAQKLYPGAPRSINPETAWGIWVLHAILRILSWTGLASLLIKFKGPPADGILLEEYGFETLPEWRE